MVPGRVAARLLAGSGRPAETTTNQHSLVRDLAAGYTLGWTILLLVAAACATIPPARWLAHHELALALHVRIRPAPKPTLVGAGWLLVNNLRATGWPLLAVLLRAHHQRPAIKRVVHAAILVSLAANLLPVAAAIGVYRAQIIPYLPHLPLELYAITTSPTAWWLSWSRSLSRRQLTAVTLSVLVALAAAAILETWAVPH